jgi:hypothetical protein
VSGSAGAGRLAEPGRLGLPRRVALTAEILVAYARVRRALRRSDIRTAIGLLRAPPRARAGTGGDGYITGVRLGKAVASVLDPLPVDSGCLPMSLVLCSLLARRGIDCSVVIGVRSDSSFGAHAWVEHGGRALLPAGATEFERLVTL